MSCRAPEQGRFYPLHLLPQFLAKAALEAHSQCDRPCIYELHFTGGVASVCVHQGKIYTLCLTGTLPDEVCSVHVEVDCYKYLYFVLIHLQGSGQYDSVRELCPFLNDYDVAKLIQNRQYQIVKTYLELVSPREIPPAAMQEPLLIELFVEAGWTFPLHTLFQYYELIFYKLYLPVVKSILKRGLFEQDEQYAEAKNRFLDFSLGRGEDDVYELVVALPS